MPIMTKLTAAALLGSLALGTAQAQPAPRYGSYGQTQQSQRYNDNAWRPQSALNAQVRNDINGLRRDIARADQRGTISDREARALNTQADRLQRLYADYARNGLTRAEAATLEQRINVIRVSLRMERRDYDGRRG